MIQENLSYLRKKYKLSQQALADRLKIPRTTLSGWERGSAEPNIDMLIRLAEQFDISLDTLLRKKIEVEDMEVLRNKDLRILAISVDADNRQNIELVDSKAEAGYLESFQDPEYIRELPKIYFPNIPEGTFRGFEIQGDSMLPMEPGTIVICTYIENLSDIKNGQTYVIASKNDGLVYKRVHTHFDKQCLTAISDNTFYPPYSISFGEIGEVWGYYAHISFSDIKSSLDHMIEDKISDIHRKVNFLAEKAEDESLTSIS